MAGKGKKQPTKKTDDATVTRIVAMDDKKPTKKVTTKKPTEVTKSEESPKRGRRNPLAAIGGYFKGAWQELRQVRWPNRRATWSLTLAVSVFTAFFAVLILLLDTGFQYLFQLMLGK